MRVTPRCTVPWRVAWCAPSSLTPLLSDRLDCHLPPRVDAHGLHPAPARRSEAQAIECLEATGWAVEAAAEHFFVSGYEPEAPPAPTTDDSKILALFDTYRAADDEDTIDAEGLTRFAGDLGIDVESDVTILAIAHAMDAKIWCQFSRSEFLAGLRALGCDSMEGLRAALPGIRERLASDTAYFTSVYAFVYDYAVEAGSKSLDMEVARGLLQLLLAGRWGLAERFCEFLGSERHAMPRDTWVMIHEFSRTCPDGDLSSYDAEEDSWPVLVDNFVEAVQEERSGAGGGGGAGSGAGRK